MLSFFVPVSSEFFLPLMRRDLLAFSFFSAGHVGTPYTESAIIMHRNEKIVKGYGFGGRGIAGSLTLPRIRGLP